MTVALIIALVVVATCLGLSVRQTRRLRREEAYLRDLNDHFGMQAQKMGDVAKGWETKFWSLHRAVGKLINERDGWKARYAESVSQHLNGQAVLEQGLTRARASAVALAKSVNAERERRKKIVTLCDESEGKRLEPSAVKELCGSSPTTPLADDEIPALDAYPRGAVESYYNNIRRWNEQAKASAKQLKKALADDREHWEKHFAALGVVAGNSKQPVEGASPAPPPPSESLEGVTVQEIREV